MSQTEKTPAPQKRRRARGREWLEGRDYYCGQCAGHRRVYCPDCLVGCQECHGSGYVKCWQCNGGAVPQPPPDWW